MNLHRINELKVKGEDVEKCYDYLAKFHDPKEDPKGLSDERLAGFIEGIKETSENAYDLLSIYDKIAEKNPRTSKLVESTIYILSYYYLERDFHNVKNEVWLGLETLQNVVRTMLSAIRPFIPEEIFYALIDFIILRKNSFKEARTLYDILSQYIYRQSSYNTTPLRVKAIAFEDIIIVLDGLNMNERCYCEKYTSD
jgi:hypothetical protein